jgi:hypothetical protein
MRYRNLTLAWLTLAFSASLAQAEMPKNVKCAIAAQEKARSEGRDYQRVYNRNFELCMLSAMPKERQTTYLIEKLQPYVAVSPGLERKRPLRQAPARSTGLWVRISPNVWVLETPGDEGQ